MKYWINGDRISVSTVTAVPCIMGDYDEGNRQPALYIVESELHPGEETVETVVFGGYEPPKTEAELEELWKVSLPSERDTDWETINTIRDEDGLPLVEQ